MNKYTHNGLIIVFFSYRIVFEKPKPGDIIAVELDIKFREEISSEYFRASVVDFVDLSSIDQQVKVKLIDEGSVEIVSVSKLNNVLKYFFS